MYRVYRFSNYPNYWPAQSTVYVDVSPGTVEEYVTDSNGTPKLVGNYIGTVTYADISEFPDTGRANRLYIDGSTNYIYRWDVTTYVQVGGGSGSAIPGGLAGQILAKDTDADYDYVWIDNFAVGLKEYVKAAESITKGQAVYISGANGDNALISKASNASEATSSKTLGLCAQSLSNNGFGYVITNGLLTGLNTGAATAGDSVWLGTGGNLLYGLANKPVAPAHMVYIGVVVRAHSTNGVINVKVQNGYELNEIHDVSVPSASLTYGMVLYRDTVNNLWKADTVENLIGYIPMPADASGFGTAINSYGSATPNDTDVVATSTVGGSPTGKKITWTNVKAFLKTYFDTIYTTTSAVASQISTALSGYATQTWVNSQGFITSVTGALGYTPENVANKENTTLDTSTTKYPTNNLVKTAVDGKVTANSAITGATKTKVTYDSKGLVTAGDDATTADIADSSNKRYVTDAQLTDIGTISSKAPNTLVGTPTEIQLAASDETTALTTSGTKVTFRMPYAMSLTSVRASLTTAQGSGSLLTIDVRVGGTSVFSTLITIDNSETTSTTAATAAVLTSNPLAISDDAEVTVHITQVGTSGAAGLKVTLKGNRA